MPDALRAPGGEDLQQALGDEAELDVSVIGRDLPADGVAVGEAEGSGGTYRLSGVGLLSATNEWIGVNGVGRFVQNGGTHSTGANSLLAVGENPGSLGTYEMSGGQLALGYHLNIGHNGGKGLFHQSGGKVATGAGWLTVSGAGSTYELGGTSETTLSVAALRMDGPLAPGLVNLFRQNGGTFTVRDWINMNASATRYELISGNLSVGNLTVQEDSGGGTAPPATIAQSGRTCIVTGLSLYGPAKYELSGTGQLSAAEERIADHSTGTFIHSGGTNTVTRRLTLGYGSHCYGANPPSPYIARYELSGTGQLTVGEEIIGYDWRGPGGERCSNNKADFVQTGGTHTVNSFLYIGYYANMGTSRYALSDGTLSSLKTWVGWEGTGEFNQTGGAFMTGSLDLGRQSGSSGVYDLGGVGALTVDGALTVGRSGIGALAFNSGSLMTDSLVIGRYSGSGGVEIGSSSAEATIRKDLTLGAKASLSVVPGTKIILGHDAAATTAARFDNYCLQPSNVVGLSNLELVLQGGPSLTHTMEVAGWDMGADEAGFVGNFKLAALQVGYGTTPANVRLVDTNNNGNQVSGKAEALYVDALRLTAGSSLDLNGLKLYCHSFCNAGGTILGGQPVQVGSTQIIDLDCDGDVDADDLTVFEACATGPAIPYLPGCAGKDFDADGDVDSDDFAVIQRRLSGASIRATPNCAN